MAENKWVVDGHHYTCPDCEKTIAIVVNESDEGFEFCPFCGKKMAGGLTAAENKMEQAAAMFGKKLFDTFHVKLGSDTVIARFSPYGFEWFDDHCIWSGNGELLNKLLIGQAVIVDE